MNLPRALLLGGAGRLPFNGHLRLLARDEAAAIWIAGRVAAGLPPEQAWPAVRRLHEALAGLRGQSAMELLATASLRLHQLDPAELGPGRGGDLALLMVAAGPDGAFFQARGLDALWTGELRPWALPTDAVPAPAPEGPLIGRCAGDREGPDAAKLRAQCGVRP